MFDLIHAFWQRRRIFARLNRFITGELSQDARREVARALDDPSVYAEYRRQRDDAHAFKSDLGSIGRPDPTAFQRGWQNVTRALDNSAPTYRLSVHTADWRVRMAAAGMVAALLIPMSLNAGRASINSIPTPPVPRVGYHLGTPTSDILPESTPEDTPGATTLVAIIAHATPTALSK